LHASVTVMERLPKLRRIQRRRNGAVNDGPTRMTIRMEFAPFGHLAFDPDELLFCAGFSL
jgi:hypothetical protein